MRLVLLLLLTFPLVAQTISFDAVVKDVVEERLRRSVKGGKNGNPHRLAALRQVFEEVQCCGEYLQEQKVSGSKLPNLICILPGESQDKIYVGAHYDAVDAGAGVVDNWSGASLLPSLYHSLKMKKNLRHTFVFLGFTDEEKGLIGSRYHARKLTKDDVQSIHAMVNIDAVGITPTKIWTSHADKCFCSGSSPWVIR